ncbi:hypothetical protein WESB_0691 [Brachyspira pilosicoli WesB]|uniref:Uncharacterized protein n=1 Tax=Brachyspira pilosicoli WesB TaxID=1161918 RepID=K0JJ75_BRAPL|nr:hypothetical protein [Brachyspira pilosicoli]CCG56161.1 hypothetical protein WESB_0691 [Brachyspira pilosicoli WesB]
MKDTIILFDNTKDDKCTVRIKGNYDDILNAYATLIYQTSIKTNKKPQDIVLDILYKVKDNEKALYKYMKKINKRSKR